MESLPAPRASDRAAAPVAGSSAARAAARTGADWTDWENVQQTEKGAVVLEDLCFAHALETGDQHVDQRQEQIGGLKIPGGLGRQDIALKQPAQTQWLTKTLQEHQTAEVSQVRVVERKRQCSQALGHGERRENAAFWVPAQPSLKVMSELHENVPLVTR